MASHILAIVIIVGFFVVALVVLLGLVDVSDPSLAKLVGLIFGYVAALLNPIIFRYFGAAPLPPEGGKDAE